MVQQQQPQPLSTNSSGSVNSRFQELIRKKSKFFSSRANNSQHHQKQQEQQNQQDLSKRHSTLGITTNHSPNTTLSTTSSPNSIPTGSINRSRTTSTYSDYIFSLDISGSSIYHSTSSTSSSIHSSNSIKSQHSSESRLTLQSLASNNNNNTGSSCVNLKADTSLLPHQSSLHRIASESPNVTNMVQPRYFSVSDVFIYFPLNPN